MNPKKKEPKSYWDQLIDSVGAVAIAIALIFIFMILSMVFSIRIGK